MASVFKEIWTGELVKRLQAKTQGTWLDGVPDNSSIVDNSVIHLVDVGVDPDVLINNTTYPIPLQTLNDGDITISLDKFQTKVTPITDDELYAVSYDKMQRVLDAHVAAINEAKFRKAAHALCNVFTDESNYIETTGAGGRLSSTGYQGSPATINDIVSMKRVMDRQGVPAEGRRLVLHPDHVNDLLLTSQAFREQYNINRADGTIGRIYGFDVYEFANTPRYVFAEKKDVGETTSDANHNASFAFYVPRVFQASGETKMYWSAAETDPEYQRNKVNFRHMYICMPKKLDCGAVLVSSN